MHKCQPRLPGTLHTLLHTLDLANLAQDLQDMIRSTYIARHVSKFMLDLTSEVKQLMTSFHSCLIWRHNCKYWCGLDKLHV